ncbi:Hypothetical_protein [Hexamita inflata]|uniref:Hypothetical_protein n=1 Tax=Hexamita inflata TaxID=28002 RepID=A0AA86RCU4_9EUKA|nr:Hypothetical protein HINF_LOCUS59291 [Hexamita inflata]
MSEERPYECDTSRYYQPYKINDKCLCLPFLVEINNSCFCNELSGFLTELQNDNCECSQRGSFKFISADKSTCVPCEERNGQIFDGNKCVCSDKYYILTQNPLKCSQCAQNQILKENKCFCAHTGEQGACKKQSGFDYKQMLTIISFILILILICIIGGHKIKEYKRKQQKMKKMQQRQVRKQNAVKLMPIKMMWNDAISTQISLGQYL